MDKDLEILNLKLQIKQLQLQLLERDTIVREYINIANEANTLNNNIKEYKAKDDTKN